MNPGPGGPLSGGQCSASFRKEDVAGVTCPSAAWDLVLKSQEGRVAGCARGACLISPGVACVTMTLRGQEGGLFGLPKISPRHGGDRKHVLNA